ncbi:MAG TPA: hypothetical protein VG297_09360 [Bryobacteraceae bacterium]|nr:hypothetical protein [Bryobacteraceae bacterium]
MIRHRADHVGSLLRPAELQRARGDAAVTPDQLAAIEDRAILDALARQKDAGLEIFTDGEFRRAGFMSDFNDSVEGLDRKGEVARAWKSSGTAAVSAGVVSIAGAVVQKIRQTKRLASHEAAFLKHHSGGDIKITLPTANQFPAIAWKKGMSEQAYPTRSDFLWDIVPIIRAEVAALVEDGIRYIQIDAPRYSYYIDQKWRGYVKDEMGMDPAEALDEAIRADNACIEGLRRAGVTIAIHLCRGNHRSRWYAEGGYDPIAEKLFNELNVDLFLLEYESERAGGFEPLRFVPRNKGVVLGLISSKVATLESPDQLRRRIEEASKYVPIESLALSPQCGFASSMEGNLLTEEEQWAKLRLVVEIARQVWR